MLPSDLPSHLDSSVISHLAAPFAHETREWILESLSSIMRHPSVPIGKTLDFDEASDRAMGHARVAVETLFAGRFRCKFPVPDQGRQAWRVERPADQRREIRAGERRRCAHHLAGCNATEQDTSYSDLRRSHGLGPL
jgi:hypothetical protein